MKKISLLMCMVLIITLLTGCGITNKTKNNSTKNNSASEEEAEKEIVCWGDSMTEGSGASAAIIRTGTTDFNASFLSYPEVLEELTGIPTYNFGAYGATSEEIGIMQGGIKPTQDIDEYDMIDFDLMEAGKEHKGDILILEIGSNGGWDQDYNVLINQYQKMINYACCQDYIIIGDTDNPGTSIADLNQQATYEDGSYIGTDDTAWEAALREAFGEHFINMRVYMIENGLDVAGLPETTMDQIEQEQGCIPSQLRADWTHFNSYGYYAQAVGVYEKGISLGYWN